MLYDVYALMTDRGQDDPVDVLRAGPKRGQLIIRRRFTNSSDQSLMAELLEPSTGQDMLTALAHVRLIAMDDKGMVIEGTQTVFERDTHKSRHHHFVQRWLCKMPGAQAVINTEKLLKRSARRLNAARASGFDPDDD